jgi:hypothetical protein
VEAQEEVLLVEFPLISATLELVAEEVEARCVVLA